MTEVLSSDDPIDDLTEEFARRWRQGERPTVEEYTERYPQWADELRAVLPGVHWLEQLKPRRGDSAPTAGPAPCPEPAPERVAEYRIVREIGRGGMGVVYEAEQEALGRRVALKMLPRHLLANETMKARFRRESRAAARLHHTNIVPVFGVGESDGQCFYVMQLIEGQGLDRVIEAAASPGRDWFRKVAEIGVQVAEALAYAHERGVLHRDIKPSNLFLDGGGTVWVTDFGVAKLVEEANLTQSGEIVGTLKYMAPEQFSGQSDSRCDVYGLGVTLYELLTLRPAFPDTTPQHLIQLITQERPARPRKVNPDIPRDLETIVLKAAARDPAERYQTAEDLAEDLRRFLDDRPILARRAGPMEQTWRWCRRNPGLAAALATAFLLMVAVTLVSVVAYSQTAAANRETAKALEAEMDQRRHAEEASTLALDALNRIYDRFAPTRLVVTPQTQNDQGVELPLQPALPPEAIGLMEDLLRTYEQIARSAEKFPKLQAQAADANYRMGEITKRLGRYEAAAAAYRTAIDLYSRQPLDAPGDSVRIKLARTCNELGWTLRALHQFDEADRKYEQALQTLSEAPRALADRPECRYELARASLMIGQRDQFVAPRGPKPGRPPRPGGPGQGPPEFGQGPPPPPDHGPRPGPGPGGPNGEHPAQKAANVLEQLVREHPSVPEYRHLLACCYRDIPPERFGRGQPLAQSNMDRAVELLRQLVTDFPRVPDYRFDLCETLGRSGPLDRFPEADAGANKRQRLEDAIAISTALVADYPNIPTYAAARARYQEQLGVALFLASKPSEAESLFRKALDVQQKMVKQHPEVVAYRFWLSVTERSLGHVLNERGEWKEALARLESAIARIEGLREKDHRFEAVRPLLGLAYRDLALALQGSGERVLAGESQRKARTLNADGAQDPFRPRERAPIPSR